MIEGTPLKPAVHRIAALLKMQQNLIDARRDQVVDYGSRADHSLPTRRSRDRTIWSVIPVNPVE
jgi:hypothetical protein